MTRSYGHLGPRYVTARAWDAAYQKVHSNEPWLTPAAVRFLSQALRPKDVGLEFGSGRSTPWLASRLAYLVSVESDRGWYEQVCRSLRNEGISEERASVLLAEQPDIYAALPPGVQSLDFCLVDGKFRDRCALAAIPAIRPGGLLVIDDSHRYLPNDDTHAPLARRSADGPASEEWAVFLHETSSWRHYWTSNGVKDTYVLIRVD